MKRIVSWLVIIVVCIYYYFANITTKNVGIPCVFKHVTGYNCSGCGTQRALHCLLHLEIEKAWYYNAFFVFFLPYYLYLTYVFIETYIVKRSVPDSFFLHKKFVIPFVILLIVFAILRNIPFEPFSRFQA